MQWYEQFMCNTSANRISMTVILCVVVLYRSNSARKEKSGGRKRLIQDTTTAVTKVSIVNRPVVVYQKL